MDILSLHIYNHGHTHFSPFLCLTLDSGTHIPTHFIIPVISEQYKNLSSSSQNQRVGLHCMQKCIICNMLQMSDSLLVTLNDTEIEQSSKTLTSKK